MAIMRGRFLGGFIIFVLLFGLAGCVSGLTLLEDGGSDYVIVVDADASEMDARAAEEFRSYFEQCSGVDLPIVHEVREDGGGMIVIGLGAAASLGVEVCVEELGEQGYLARTVGENLVIAGTEQIGTLYGVDRFLEDYLGVRWLAPGVTRIDEIEDLELEELDEVVEPAFGFRFTSYTWPGRDADFLTRIGDNYAGGRGGSYRFDRLCHSYFVYVSPGEFFESHPEYFSEINGERLGTETQLCLTNPEVLEIVTERMLARIEENPGIRQFNFSQMDYYNQCQCSNCRAMNERYGTDGGTQFWFVNQLAERISAVHPDVQVGTLAYTFTEEPPVGMRMHPNAAIWLCHMFPCCDSHPIATCDLNAQYKDRAERWSEICDHLFIWHYVVDFAHYYNPFPNLRAVAADLRFYRDIGAEGIFLQGMGHDGGGGEFSLLRPYVLMKLVWDPDQDLDVLLDDFLTGYYGAAAGPIKEYIDMLHDYVADNDVHLHLYVNPGRGHLPDEIVARAMELFDDAERAVGTDAELLERVRVARMPLQYARMFPRNGYDVGAERLRFRGEFASMMELAGFLQRMRNHGFSVIREYAGDPQQLLPMLSLFHSGAQVVTLENEYLTVNIVPVLGGRILRIVDKASGECVTANNVAGSLYFPYAGGLENRVGNAAFAMGWMEPATVVRTDGTEAVLVQRTVNDYRLRRVISLVPGEARMNIETTITNDAEGARATVLRSHGELDLGELRGTSIWFTDRAGQEREVAVNDVIAGLREGVHLYEDDTPRGSWCFSGTKGLRVTHGFEDEQVEFAWLYSYPESQNRLEWEIWMPERVLEPNESMVLNEYLEVQVME